MNLGDTLYELIRGRMLDDMFLGARASASGHTVTDALSITIDIAFSISVHATIILVEEGQNEFR